MKILLAGVLCLFTMNITAEVVDATNNFFHVRIIGDVSASHDQAYNQFIRIGEWWSSDHTWFGNAANMAIETRVGGCYCERAGDKEAWHMMVSYIDPGKEIHLLGGLGPLQMLALDGAMSWKFTPIETGGSKIIMEYRVTGGGQKDMPALAKAVDRVLSEQFNRLVEKLTSGVNQHE